MQKFFQLILGATTLALCIIVIAHVWRHKYSPTVPAESAAANVRMQAAIAERTLAEWKKKKYVPTQNPAELKVALAELNTKLEHHPLMSLNLATNLTGAIDGFIEAFSVGNFQSYKDFRFPNGSQWSPTTNGSRRLDDYFVKLPTLRPVSYSFLRYWRLQYQTNRVQPPANWDEKFKSFVYDYSGRQFYSNYIAGVCVDELAINIERLKKPLPKLRQDNFAFDRKEIGFSWDTTNFPNLRYMDLGADSRRMFDLKPSLQEVLDKGKDVLCADCLIFTEIQCPEETYKPFLIRFYWADEPGKWLVDDLVDGNFYSATNSNYLVVF